MFKRKKIEDGEQRAIVSWSKSIPLPKHELFEPNKTLFDYLYHVPNGGGRSKAEAGVLKTMGVKAGVSDLVLAIPTSEYAGLYIELKPPRSFQSRVSKEQLAWKNRMNRVGYLCRVAYGFEEAVALIADYLTEFLTIRKITRK